jgi:hypothetical protein
MPLLQTVPPSAASPALLCSRAVIYAWTGRPELALADLERLAKLSPAEDSLLASIYRDFLLDPVWEPLRFDLRFASLIERLTPAPTMGGKLVEPSEGLAPWDGVGKSASSELGPQLSIRITRFQEFTKSHESTAPE